MAFTILPLILSALVFSYIGVANITSAGEKRLKEYRETLLSERKEKLRNYVEIALKAIQDLPQKEAAVALKKLRYENSGYFFLADFNNFVYSHPDPKVEGKDLSDLKDPNGVYIVREVVRVCEEKGEGYTSYMWKTPGGQRMQPKLTYAKTIGNWKWIIATGIYVDDIDALVVKEREKVKGEVASLILQNLLIAFIIVIFLSVIITYFVNKYINMPIARISSGIRNFNNDLTNKITVTTDDEIGELTKWFNDYVGNLRKIIRKVSDATMGINSYAGRIADAVESQAAIAAEELAGVTEITSTIEELSASYSQIADHSKSVAAMATRTLDNSKEGAQAVESIIVKTSEISTDNQNSIKEIVELGRKSKEISKVMEIINNIADQTKLIAFNAALEASSAGEAGKRFGVVAVEIRRLADSVMESTEEIENNINEIQKAINRLVIASEKGSKVIQQGIEHSNRTERLLMNIVDAAQATTDATKQISLSTTQQKTAGDQVVIALREIMEGANQSSASMESINGISKEMAAVADDLKNIVGHFKLGDRRD